MHSPPQFVLYFSKFCTHAVPPGLTLDKEMTLPGGPANKRASRPGTFTTGLS